MASEIAEKQRGAEAKYLLGHPMIVEAFESMRADNMRKWNGTSDEDSTGREACWHRAQVIDEMERHLTTILETGKLANIAAVK